MTTRAVVVLCTGNVARSAALGILLADARPDLDVTSAAIGANATAGRRMAKPMRERFADSPLAAKAESHRSRLLVDAFAARKHIDILICTAAVHVRRLTAVTRELGIDRPPPYWLLDPPLPDPAFGGRPAYAQVWPMIQGAAQTVARHLPPNDDGAAGDVLAWFAAAAQPDVS